MQNIPRFDVHCDDVYGIVSMDFPCCVAKRKPLAQEDSLELTAIISLNIFSV